MQLCDISCWYRGFVFLDLFLYEILNAVFVLTYLMRFHDNDFEIMRMLKIQNILTMIDDPTTAP